MNTLYWYDYETFGNDPSRDRAAQFAGLRTDYQFNPVGNPTVVYCRPSPDFLPHPDACLITGITPQIATERGIVEYEFIRQVNSEFSKPDTCVLGYNSIRFDDEVTRYTLYRNLLDPYAREWRNGNSRWDLIDVARMTMALRPDGINWPMDERGLPTFKLEMLTAHNDIKHEDAHDALSDVIATIALARLIKERQPRLFQFLFENKSRQQAAKLLALGAMKPLVHASSRFPAEKSCIAVVVAVAKHPLNKNGIVTFDLSADPEPLISLGADEIADRLFMPTANLPAGVQRIPLKTVHLNKCPALAPLSVIRPEDIDRLSLDVAACKRHLEQLKLANNLEKKIQEVMMVNSQSKHCNDVDLALYDGFTSEHDRNTLDSLSYMEPTELAQARPHFDELKYQELLLRFRARNYPHTLDTDEQNIWKSFCRGRLNGTDGFAKFTFKQFDQRMSELQSSYLTEQQSEVLKELALYADNLRTFQDKETMPYN